MFLRKEALLWGAFFLRFADAGVNREIASAKANLLHVAFSAGMNARFPGLKVLSFHQELALISIPIRKR
jgi:hypothetical protein